MYHPAFLSTWANRIQINPDAAEKYQLLCDTSLSEDPNNPESDGIAFYPTALDKVDHDIARSLVGRGYANTSLTLFNWFGG